MVIHVDYTGCRQSSIGTILSAFMTERKTARKSTVLTLKDKLSRLTYLQACKLLGPDGAKLIMRGGRFDIDIDRQVRMTNRQFRLELFEPTASVVTIRLADNATGRLTWHCSTSSVATEEVAAAFALILEEKTALGLAAAPEETLQRNQLSELEINAIEVAAREKRAKEERMTVRALDPKTPWTDYQVTNKASGKTYRVALRGHHPGESFCSCPDYRKNTFGVCKHTLHVLEKVKRKFPKDRLRRPFVLKEIIVYLQYGKELQLRVGIPDKPDGTALRFLRPYRQRAVTDIPGLIRAIGKLENAGQSVTL